MFAIFVYGAMLICIILKDPDVYEEWCEDLKFHSEREIWISCFLKKWSLFLKL